MASKQTEIPGMEAPKIKEIEQAAEAYTSVRDKRMALTVKEVAAKMALIEVVQAHARELAVDDKGNSLYCFDDQVVKMKPGKPNVTVRAAASDGDDDDDE